MKVLMLAPAHASAARGNLVTVQRWRRELEARGHDVTVATPDEAAGSCGAYDLVHAHHAVHCGPAALACRSRGLSVVVSLGGTDLNGGPEGRPDPRARTVFEGVDRIVGPFVEDGDRLRAAIPAAAPFRLVRRGVQLPDEVPPRSGEGLVGLMAGGIRLVKGQLDALGWARALRARGLPLTLRVAGPSIDEDYFADFLAEIATGPDAYLGVLEPDDLRLAMIDADFVLNASLHEGASNALLEALALGRPVAARLAAGNREMLAAAPPEAALLIDPERDGLDRLGAWLTHLQASDRVAIARTARAFVSERFSVAHEIDELEAVYRELVEP